MINETHSEQAKTEQESKPRTWVIQRQGNERIFQLRDELDASKIKGDGIIDQIAALKKSLEVEAKIVLGKKAEFFNLIEQEIKFDGCMEVSGGDESTITILERNHENCKDENCDIKSKINSLTKALIDGSMK